MMGPLLPWHPPQPRAAARPMILAPRAAAGAALAACPAFGELRRAAFEPAPQGTGRRPPVEWVGAQMLRELLGLLGQSVSHRRCPGGGGT